MLTSDTQTLVEASYKAALKTKVGKDITGEVIRMRVMDMGLEAMVPNVWGSIIGKFVRAGLLVKTDKTTPAVSSKARGRRLSVYERAAIDTNTKKILLNS